MWRYLRRQRDAHAAEGKASYEKAVQQQLEEEDEEEPLEEVSRRLISQEEELFSQESTSEREVDELQRDYEALQLQLWMAVNDTFTSSSSSSTSSSSSLGALRSAVLSVQQQEAQDQSWRGRGAEVRVPAWRPLRCLRTHNELLQKMVESRLAAAEEEEPGGAEGLSSPLKREVCCLGRRVKEDLLMVWRTVKDCYPASMDILNFYAALYHRTFSAHLTQVAVSGPASSDCGYILFWVNHYYPQEVLQHQELDGRIKTACLGSLLPQEHLEHLENQYLNHKEEKVKLWLTTALRKEEEGWLNGGTPELIDHYCFSPLAVDVIQLMDGCLSELRCVVRDQTEARRITSHLERFLSSYRKCVEEMAKRDGSSVRQGLKAHLVCEWQLREYVTAQTGSAMSGQQRARCLDTMAALRDCGYKCLSMAIHLHLKRCFCQVWTSRWLDGSLPVIDSLLDFLNQQLSDWTDLQPACRESLLSRLQQDVVLRYVKRVMKTGPKGEKQQVDGARRMIEDAQKINDFFSEGGCTGSLWLGEMLCQLAEVLRLQDPGSVQLEMVSVANTFSDLSDAHVSALLSLKSTLSGADVRAIRRSVAENRLPAGSANQGNPFFSMVKVKWVHNKLTQIGLRRGMVLVGP